MSRIAIYPGTFDPLTKGHIDIIERALLLFDQIIVAVASNPGKHPFFSYDKRIELTKSCLSSYDQVIVEGFDGLFVNFAQSKQARIVIRGLRAVSDFEYEFMLAGMNRQLMPDIETVYLMPSDEYMFISSSFVRELARLHGDIDKFVPKEVKMALFS